MLIKIKRRDAFDQYPKFPWHKMEEEEEEFYFPTAYKSGIITLPSNSMEEHIGMLSSSLVKWMKALNAECLIFLGDTETPWLYQDNDYGPVKAAFAYLKDNNVSKQFNGALEVSVSEMNEFIEHLFWLTRCNAAFPIAHFMDKEQSMVGNICQHGNVHFSLLRENVSDPFEVGDFKPQHHISCALPFKLKDT